MPKPPKRTLCITGLRIERGDTCLVRHIDWSVSQGQHWVILGPNGCGKTSLLKCLMGYLPASHGELELLGRRFGECDWRELRLHIGMVSSALQASIPPAEPVLETVISGRYAQLDLWHRVSSADRRQARAWLRFFNAEYLEERPWVFLSQGERQKILICRALMSSPKLLILDEPCAGLDPLARRAFLSFLSQLAAHRQCPSLVLVTHHVEEIIPEITHTLLLRAGEVLASGPLKKTLTTKNLGACFGTKLSLRHTATGYELKLPRLS